MARKSSGVSIGKIEIRKDGCLEYKTGGELEGLLAGLGGNDTLRRVLPQYKGKLSMEYDRVEEGLVRCPSCGSEFQPVRSGQIRCPECERQTS